MILDNLLKDPGRLLGKRLFSIGETPITLEKAVVALFLLALIVVASRLLQRAMVRALRMRGLKEEGTILVLRRLLHYLVMAVGLLLVLESIGISLGALFAAGAVFAIGLGFAVQNVVQNFVSGIILLVERTIKPGDVIQVEGRAVKVGTMGIRTTIARTLDEEEIIVPNSSIVQATVVNYTLQDSLYRLRCAVGVTYGSDMALVRKVLQETGERMELRTREKEPVVLLIEFGDSSVVWEVSVWIDDPWAQRRARSELNEAIWWALKEAGIVIAFPQIDVHFDRDINDSLTKLARAS
ncbi:MAG: mechanosensitive ion channel domain-containing protein [Candidatus Eisenbacteria bacterium]